MHEQSRDIRNVKRISTASLASILICFSSLTCFPSPYSCNFCFQQSGVIFIRSCCSHITSIEWCASCTLLLHCYGVTPLLIAALFSVEIYKKSFRCRNGIHRLRRQLKVTYSKG
uniref:Uncharacterized protein n=1 Tax=Parascaris univalens TaxID=6257 RepID=A0A915A1D3_PARUN